MIRSRSVKSQRIFLSLFLCLIGFSISAQGQEASGINFDDLKHNALLSAVSYASPESVPDRLSALKHSLVKHSILATSQVSYFLSHKKVEGRKKVKSNGVVQVLSFRGTSNLENVLVDLDVSLVADKHLNIILHQGFASASWAAYQEIKPKLDKANPIHTTGHSLGGAIAVIVAMYLKNDGYDVQQVMTFGQPKVTNVAGARAFSDLPVVRIVTPKDIVPLVPPLSPLQLQNLDIYWHMGEEIILLPGKQYSKVSGLKSMMRATKFFSAVPDDSNIHAHQMATYLSLIKEKQVSAEEVPFKLGISLFGLTVN